MTAKKIHVPMTLALRLCDWHSSSRDPIYAAGSSGIAKQAVPEEIFRDAISNMEANLDHPAHSENKQEIVEIVSQMKSLLGEGKVRECVVAGMARIFWADCWVGMVERGEVEANVSGCEITHIAPTTPARTVALASELLEEVEELNDKLVEKMVEESGTDAYDFGGDLAMACLSWDNDLPDDFKTPYVESIEFLE